VFANLGADVLLWPVRSRPPGPDPVSGVTLLGDLAGPDACAGADLVVVATDTARHADDAVLALDAGCARLLVEKPVTATVAGSDRLTSHPLADRVFVAAPLRAHQGFRLLASRLADLSGPYAVEVHCQSWLPDWRPERDYRQSYSARPDEGGVLRDLVHEIDYATVLFGMPGPAGLVARLAWDGPLEISAEQAANLLWTTTTATVALRLDYITRPPRRGITVTGADGALSWDVLAGTVQRTDSAGTAQEWRFAADLDRDAVLATQAAALLDLDPTDPAAARLAAGAPATLAEGVRVVGICDDARSAAKGQA
jgi:predicted dehydrogenase